MIKPGLYHAASTNQRIFYVEIFCDSSIKTWYAEADGISKDPWWDMDISSERATWLVGEWNNGNIKKAYPHWWEKVDSRKQHINSLFQLTFDQLQEVLNYAAYVLPHSEWTTRKE
jgi:hypothetical protein